MPLIILIIFIFSFVTCFSQEVNKATAFHIEGQVAFTTNGKAGFINFGGPSIKLSRESFAIAINFMPSLRFEKSNETVNLTPILGVGPQIYFPKRKKFFVGLPCYYYANRNIWVVTAGVGYVLSKQKSNTK